MEMITLNVIDKLAEVAQVRKVVVEVWVSDENDNSESVVVKPWVREE